MSKDVLQIGDIRRMPDGSVYFVTLDKQSKLIAMWFHLNIAKMSPSVEDEYVGNLADAFNTFRDKLDEPR